MDVTKLQDVAAVEITIESFTDLLSFVTLYDNQGGSSEGCSATKSSNICWVLSIILTFHLNSTIISINRYFFLYLKQNSSPCCIGLLQ